MDWQFFRICIELFGGIFVMMFGYTCWSKEFLWKDIIEWTKHHWAVIMIVVVGVVMISAGMSEFAVAICK